MFLLEVLGDYSIQRLLALCKEFFDHASYELQPGHGTLGGGESIP